MKIQLPPFPSDKLYFAFYVVENLSPICLSVWSFPSSPEMLWCPPWEPRATAVSHPNQCLFLFPWTSKNVITLWPLSLSFSQSWKSSTPENCTGSLCKMYYWLPSCIIQSQWTLFDAVSRYCDLIRRQTWVYVAVSVLQSSLRLLFLHKSMVNTPSCVGKTVPNDLNLLWEARGLLMSRSRSFI